MKVRILLLMFTIAPFFVTAQFSSVQRQMNSSNAMVRQQNLMSLQIQRQQRDLAYFSNMSASTEKKLASEEKRNIKYILRSKEKETALNAEQTKLTNLQNSVQNNSDTTNKSIQKSITKAQKNVTKAQKELNELLEKTETSNSKIKQYQTTIADSNKEKEVLKAKKEEKKRLKKEKNNKE